MGLHVFQHRASGHPMSGRRGGVVRLCSAVGWPALLQDDVVMISVW
jgi:hypothetical protein